MKSKPRQSFSKTEKDLVMKLENKRNSHSHIRAFSQLKAKNFEFIENKNTIDIKTAYKASNSVFFGQKQNIKFDLLQSKAEHSKHIWFLGYLTFIILLALSSTTMKFNKTGPIGLKSTIGFKNIYLRNKILSKDLSTITYG